MKSTNAFKLGVIALLWVGMVALNSVLLSMRYSPRVKVEAVAPAPLELMVRAAGNLEAKASVMIKAQFDGPVVSKNFREGEQVSAGQLLAVIGQDRIRLDYQAKSDALHNAKTDLVVARKEVKLQKTLYGKQAVAYSAVEDAERNLVKATQTLRSATEAFVLEQKRWDTARVIAPFPGTVVRDSLGDDKSVVAGKEIVTVADVSEFTVKGRVDELDIKQVVEQQPSEVRLQIYPDKVFKARVTQIGSQSDTSESSAIPVVVTLEGTQGVLLRPKLTADIRILTGRTSPVLSVPLSAVVNTDGNPKVWVLDRWYRLRLRAVTLGRTNPERAEVTQGLDEKESVAAVADPAWAPGMQAWRSPK